MAANDDTQRQNATKPRIKHSLSTYAMTLVFGWLLPGAGFWMLGQRVRAVLHCVVITGLFWSGQYLAEGRAVNRDIHPIFFYGQVGNGASTLLSQYSVQSKPPRISQRGRPVKDLPAHLSTGINFTTISGLLNLLLILHLADPRTWRGEVAGATAAKDDARHKGEGKA